MKFVARAVSEVPSSIDRLGRDQIFRKKTLDETWRASEPEALLAVLVNPAYHFKRIGLEAGPLSQWLYSALAEAELPVICVETRHMRAREQHRHCNGG